LHVVIDRCRLNPSFEVAASGLSRLEFLMRVKDLMHRLSDRPFRGFRIHLSDGTAIPVNDPGMIIVGPSSAILPTEFGQEDGERVVTRWRTVALSHMVQFADLDEPVGKNPKKRKK
jgi:hypothetical protein